MDSCNPCTQQDDFDFQPELEAAERLGSPVPMDFDDEAEAAGVDAAGVDALAARSERLSPPPLPEHVAPPPPPPPPALRRTARATAGVPEARFADSKESQRDDHDARRLGSRHDRVRDVSYPEALAQIDELNLQKEAWLHEVKTLIEQADQIVSEMPPESQVHASDRFEEGWLVVKARWFEIVTTSPRCYKLRSEERTLVVSEMIRLSTIRFDKVVKRSPRLGDSQFFLSEDTHNMIESCVRDQDV